MSERNLRENTRVGIDASVEDFSIHMKHKLLLTRHRPHWKNCSLQFLFDRLILEVDELQDAIENSDSKSTIREAADVANFAMMIADNEQWAGDRP